MEPVVHRGLARPPTLFLKTETRLLNSFPLNKWTLCSFPCKTWLLPSFPRRAHSLITHPLGEASRNLDRKELATNFYQTLNYNKAKARHRMKKEAHQDPAVAQTSVFLESLTSEASLLERLRPSNNPFDTLRYESDICDRLDWPTDAETRLVDQEQHAQNMNLWLEILRFRRRIDGQDGVMDVLDQLHRRRIVLNGPPAQDMWSVFFQVTISNPPLLLRLYSYAVDIIPVSDLRQLDWYARVMNAFLRQDPKFVRSWHSRMRRDGLLPVDPRPLLVQLIKSACLSHHFHMAIDAFKYLYLRFDIRDLYHDCMLRVWELADFRTAVDLHAFFDRHKDLPSPRLSLTPIVAHLRDHRLLARSNARFRAQSGWSRGRGGYESRFQEAEHAFLRLKASHVLPSPETLPAMTREGMNTIVGDVHGIKEKELGDAFCARLFATTAFSTDLIISGLRLLGLKTVGPLALREVAARVRDCSEYVAVVDALKATGISISVSLFARALLSFAQDPKKRRSFQFLVSSDQHPNAYEDQVLQKKLYAQFLAAGRVPEANALLDILTLDHPTPDHYHANLLLETYVRRGERQPIVQIIHQMRLQQIPVFESSLWFIQHTCLRPRAPSKKPITQEARLYKDDLDFVTNIYLDTMRSGQSFSPSNWKPILKRYGMSNRLDALEKLCLWLVVWYSRVSNHVVRPLFSTSTQGSTSQTTSVDPGLDHPLSTVFSGQFLRALISWGFKSDIVPSAPMAEGDLVSIQPTVRGSVTERFAVERWARGIALVRTLRRFGVKLENARLRREVLLSLWTIYGPERSNRRINRVAQTQNKLSLVHRVRHIEKVWGGGFFTLPSNLLEGLSVTDMDMYRAIFTQQRRKTGRRRRVQAEAEA